MFFTDKNGVPSGSLNININKFVTLEMTYSLADNITKITSDSGGGTITLNLDFSISLINFQFTGKGYSPAIALHWTLYKIDISNPNEKLRPNFSLKGKGLCSYTNPCVKGYACTRGICVKCHMGTNNTPPSNGCRVACKSCHRVIIYRYVVFWNIKR